MSPSDERGVEVPSPRYDRGDRVRALVDHDMGLKGRVGEVVDARAGEPAYYAVLLDGDAAPHKWFAEHELEPETDDEGDAGDEDDGETAKMPMKAAKPSRGKPTPPSALPKLERAMTIALAGSGSRADTPDDDRIEIALSSEDPYRRWFGVEILGHDSAEVDISRARDGLPLLHNHNTDEQIGVVDEVRIDTDKVIRGKMRFSKSPRAQEIRQDVVDGIRRNASIGYLVDEMKLLESDEEHDVDTYRVTKWRLLEGSIVAVPADARVGVGRSTGPTYPVRLFGRDEAVNGDDAGGAASVAEPTPPADQPAAKARSVTVSEQNTAANAAIPKSRAEEILEIAELAGAPLAKVSEWRSSTKDLAEIRREAVALRAAGAAAAVSAPAPTVEDYREKGKRFDLGRAILAAKSGNWKDAGYERAVSQSEAKRLGKDAGSNTVFMPTLEKLSDEERERRELAMQTRVSHSVSVAANGGNAKFTEYGGFIDFLYNRSVVMQLGATVLPGLQGDVAFPRQITKGSTFWLAELAGGVDVTESNVTLDQVVLAPKTLMAKMSYSNQLLAQGAINIDAVIRADLAKSLALEIDRAAIHGSGAANQPQGIYGATGVNTFAAGGVISYVIATKMAERIEAANADIGSMAYVTTPEVKQDAMTTQVFASTNGAPVWTGSAADGSMAGYRAVASNQVSKTLGVGSDHGIVFGVWPELLIGEWGALSLTVDPYTLAGQDVVRIIARQFADIDLRHPQSFCTASTLAVTA